MRKAVVIIAAVAILGALAMFNSKNKTQGSTDTPAPVSSNVQPSSTPTNTSPAPSANAAFKDGTFTGALEENPYGPVQVAAVISGGKITDINFLQMPSEEGHSREVTNFSKPLLKSSAISHQSANIDFVSGATDTSASFSKSLQAALNQAAI